MKQTSSTSSQTLVVFVWWTALGLLIWWLAVTAVSYCWRIVLGVLAFFVLPVEQSSGSVSFWVAWLVLVVVLGGVGWWGTRFLQRRFPQIPAWQSAVLYLISDVLALVVSPDLLPVSVGPQDSVPGLWVASVVSACAVVLGAWLGARTGDGRDPFTKRIERTPRG
jgi:hypothetical protein